MDWVVSDDVPRESWSRLLEYANSDFAFEAISKRHGVPGGNSVADNYRKQAQQIRACLLQSQEYFSAAKHSSLITSPNHAYYGMVSLASSIMLMLGDGKKALDFLRQDAKNKNHGLRFTSGVTKSTAGKGLRILEQSFAEVLSNGHFRLWYETLPLFTASHGLETRHLQGSHMSRFIQLGSSECKSFSALNGNKYSVLRLMQYLPDLHSELGRYGARLPSSRFAHEVVVDSNLNRADTWLIHGAGSPAALDDILGSFSVPARNAAALVDHIQDHADGGVVQYKWEKADEPITFHFPSSRLAMSFDRICYADDLETTEFVDFYIASFILSMLSRYYPDLWVSCLESNCLAAKLIERYSSLVKKKVPMLALSLISGRDCFISSNRPPWAK